ncbi:HEAT repeat domain-containing protein [Streptomyces sp. NPDC005811]|uniref:HEAT repeat domain-containing protein n=1 Tax=Streptomyces sp. NPDC005811 TaxID=3154565 RepID=UPI003404E7E6
MFTGIDRVDWAALRHAHGSAEDVPGLLRGLASEEPGTRHGALDGLYDAVHGEGRVYDATLACVPFLLALAADERVPERGGLVELLVSIGTATTGAGAAVGAGGEVFARLTGDPDPEVRRAAAGALVRFLDEPARVLGLLRRRLAVEREDRLVISLVECLGEFARRCSGGSGEAVELLAGLSAAPYRPGSRLAALGQLAAHAPGRLPADLVPTVLGLLEERAGDRARHARVPADGAAYSLADRLRRLAPSDEEGARLLRTLHTALDDRLTDRIALLHGQLTGPVPADRYSALPLCAALFREWRGDHRATVALIGEGLRGTVDGERDRWCDTAVSVLESLFALAAPAADGLHARVVARPDLWVRRWPPEAPALGAPLRALARAGDPRAVPVLARLAEEPVPPRDLGSVVVHLGARAAPLAPALRRALAATPPGAPERALPLVAAVGVLRDGEAVPSLLRLLKDVPEYQEGEHALAVVDALWSIEGDAGAVLPVLLREAARGDSRCRARAARGLGRLGGAARAALPVLRAMAAPGRPGPERTAAACAVARVTREVEPGDAALLRAAWAGHPHTRVDIAACLAALGPGAAPLRDLAAAELAAPRRHTARPDGHGSHDIPRDEELLRLCREVVSGSA